MIARNHRKRSETRITTLPQNPGPFRELQSKPSVRETTIQSPFLCQMRYFLYIYGMKLFIVSNRLPVRARQNIDGGLEFVRSEGGLATGLSSLSGDIKKIWIGWPGVNVEKKSEEDSLRSKLEKLDYHPVFLTGGEYDNYYEGYSNSTLWPLCHYFYPYSRFRNEWWLAYQEVNRKFCEEVLEYADEESMVWVQDYQLMLLPGMLRKRRPDLHVGFFLHIPFPSWELFRLLPDNQMLIEGLLGADYLAFHTTDYMRHFISAVMHTTGNEFKLDELMIGNRAIHVEALPMGINYKLYNSASAKPGIRQAAKDFKAQVGEGKIMLSVDRLDYTKGIMHRLEAYRQLLEHHPEYRGKVTLAMVIVPSRDNVAQYDDMKRRINEKVSEIAGRFANLDWTPIHYFYHAFPFEELLGLYLSADIALVTPLRDGMNLVAKEYVACKKTAPGVLILSKMAGAAFELKDAIQINPNNINALERAMIDAINMPLAEQNRRLRRMRRVVSAQNVNKWAGDFLKGWKLVTDRNKALERKLVNGYTLRHFRSMYRKSANRLFLLDYDGTLVGFQDKPEDAVPTKELESLLEELSSDSRNSVVINSGRDREWLEKCFGDLPVTLIAEHGAFYKEGGNWHRQGDRIQWNRMLVRILNAFVSRTPGSHLERKSTALAWHYREVDSWMGAFRAQQLMRSIMPLCVKLNLQLLHGNKVVEIKPAAYTKGTEVKRILGNQAYDFILCMGDDVTDEDMFKALPESAVCVKVGEPSEFAPYNIPDQKAVIPMLNRITEKRKQGK